MKVDLLPTKVTIDQGNLVRKVIKSWNEDLLNVYHLMHDNLVVYFKTPKSILRKSTDMQRPIQRVKFTKAIARHTFFSRPKSFARIHLPRLTSSAQPQRSKI